MEEAHPPNGAASKDEREPTWQDAGTFADFRNRSHLCRTWLHDQALHLQPRCDVLAARRPQLPQLSGQAAGSEQGLNRRRSRLRHDDRAFLTFPLHEQSERLGDLLTSRVIAVVE
jgi:hypothetical protein